MTGPPLPKTLRLLAPLAPTLDELDLGNNELGGTITDDIAAFTKLSVLMLYNMGLEGAWYDQTYPNKNETALAIARTGPPLPETLRLLAPLAPTLEKLHLSYNKLGGTITADIVVFTKLTELGLDDMNLQGQRSVQARRRRSELRSESHAQDRC